MLTEEDFSLDELVARMKKPEMGCIVAFLGIVRRDDEIKGLNVESDEEALKELEALCEEAKEKFGVVDIQILHRKGFLSVGENIVAILVGASHRKEAFKACEFLIDELRKKGSDMEGGCEVSAFRCAFSAAHYI
ncbi:MAG: Molybdopterin synthase catalytic subunit MoaE [Methanophagales archaeon]|nr:molybdenum cofactor biosynthesis protein MoaE [Methanophagales archaeon]MCU4140569.1 Molybdopterin synthase catalytic subunit MoaE [Methanophagales archaeon]